MATDAQIRANRLNAQKSTGPKTAEGKARSRRNSLKHGLAGAGIVLPIEDEALFLERLPGFSNSLLPGDEMEHFLVARVVLASVRMDRCARKDLADASKRRRKAVDRWESEQDRDVRFWAGRLAANPDTAVENLEGTAAGCDWLIERWDELAEALDDPGSWDEAQAGRALNLIGLAGADADDDRARALHRLALAIRPEPTFVESDALVGEDTSHLDPEAQSEAIGSRMPAADEARETLRSLARGEQARLVDLRAELWREQDGPDLAEAIASAGVDADPVDVLRHRYEAEASREFHRSLNQLDRRRREADLARRRGSQLATPGPARVEPDPPPPSGGPTGRDEADYQAANPYSKKTWTNYPGSLAGWLARRIRAADRRESTPGRPSGPSVGHPTPLPERSGADRGASPTAFGPCLAPGGLAM